MNENKKIPIPVQILSGFLLLNLVLAPFQILAVVSGIKRIYYNFNMEVNWLIVLLPVIPYFLYIYFLFLAWNTLKLKSNVTPNLFLYYYVVVEILYVVVNLSQGFLLSFIIIRFFSMDITPSHETIINEILLYSWPFTIGSILFCILWFIFWFYYFHKSNSVFKYYGSNASLLSHDGSLRLTHAT